MIQRKAGKEATSELNLTPMIDIVFHLLILVMVTAIFAISPGLAIKLPESEESEAPEKENLFIVIDEQGAMKLNHKSVTYASLKRELMEKRKILDNTTMIVIQADEKVFHGQVVKVMDISKAAGITDLVVATEPKDR